MVAFPPAFLDELVARNPIEDVVSQYVALTKKGSNLFGLCPFHGEKTASFSVAVDKGIYYCFGCHKGGGVVNFAMEIENLSYPDAVRFLAKRAGLTVPEDETYQSRYKEQERLWALSGEAARYFRHMLFTPEAQAAQQAIMKRGFNRQTINRFGFGYAPPRGGNLIRAMQEKGFSKQEMLEAGLAVKSERDGSIYPRFRDRLMVPIIDLRGNVIGFGGRVLGDGEPKYLNSPETIIFNKRKNLFALNYAKKTKMDALILCEGYMDAIALHQYGFDGAVASLGTALTEEQANLISKYKNQVILTYDSDEAGQNATRRAIPILEKTGLQVRVLRMNGAKDPDEFLRKFGTDRFQLLLDGSENQAEFLLSSLQKKFDLLQDDQRVEYLKQAAMQIAKFHTAVEREIYGARVAQTAGITAEAMKIEVNKAYKKLVSKQNKEQERIDLSPAASLQPKVRSLHYDNVKSAVAEEALLRMLLDEPTLFEKIGNLTQEHFSAPVLGKTFAALLERYQQGLAVSLPVLEGILSAEEMTHMSAVMQKRDSLVSEQAFADYCSTIIHESERKKSYDGSDLLALRNRMKDKRNYGG